MRSAAVVNVLPLRLRPGCDLRRSLEEAAARAGLTSAFVVSGIGSLADVALRFAGADTEARLAGSFEIVALSGTISPDGAHLHMAVLPTPAAYSAVTSATATR